MDPIERLEARALALRQELAETETAIMVFRRLNAKPATPPPAIQARLPLLAGTTTTTEAMRGILKDGQLSKAAIRDRLHGMGLRVTENTITSTLSQKKQFFESKGAGMWALRTP